MNQRRIKPIHLLWFAFTVHLVMCLKCAAFYIYVGRSTFELADAKLRKRIQSEVDIERLRSTALQWFNIVDDDSRYLASERKFIRQTSFYLVVCFTSSLTLL